MSAAAPALPDQAELLRQRAIRLEVRFYERLRAEKKFPSPEALRVQIQRDVERTRRFFANLRRLKANDLSSVRVRP